MKSLRLVYPDYLSGGLKEYYLGAKLLTQILPQNSNQPSFEVPIAPPSEAEFKIENGIFARNEVIQNTKKAQDILTRYEPEKVITIGGTCYVSLASFDYLHALYPKLGIVWIDAHPDVSSPKDNYPNAHAFVLGTLLGEGDEELLSLLKNKPFKADELLYIGLQELHSYQKEFLDKKGVSYKVQDKDFVSDEELKSFIDKFDALLVHFDIDVLSAEHFSDTYFANPTLVGDGSGGGKMSLEKLTHILNLLDKSSKIVGFSIAEYLPFSAYKLQELFKDFNFLKS